MDYIPREPASAAPCHLVPSGKEGTHALTDIVIDAAERGNRGPPIEVSSTIPVVIGSGRHALRPGICVARYQQLTHFRLEPLHALLRGARTHVQVHTRTWVVWMVRAKRIAEKVEALPPGILQRGFALVDRQPDLGHHRLRPCQSLGRVTATEDDKVVSIGNDVGTEDLITSG